MARNPNRDGLIPVEIGVLGLVLAFVTAILGNDGNFDGAATAGIIFVALFVGNFIFEKLSTKKNS